MRSDPSLPPIDPHQDIVGAALEARDPDFLFTPYDKHSRRLLIDALAKPDESLHQIAQRCRTSVEALALWMARPDVEKQLATTKSALHAAILSLHTTVKQHLQIEADKNLAYTDQPYLDYKRHTRDAARKAATLLHKIARPRPTTRPVPPTSPPRTTDNNLPTKARSVPNAGDERGAIPPTTAPATPAAKLQARAGATAPGPRATGSA